MHPVCNALLPLFPLSSTLTHRPHPATSKFGTLFALQPFTHATQPHTNTRSFITDSAIPACSANDPSNDPALNSGLKENVFGGKPGPAVVNAEQLGESLSEYARQAQLNSGRSIQLTLVFSLSPVS